MSEDLIAKFPKNLQFCKKIATIIIVSENLTLFSIKNKTPPTINKTIIGSLTILMQFFTNVCKA